jgi:uncharacterized protein (DUF885 family)
MSAVYDLCDEYVERYAALDPIGATFEGLPGHDDELTDYSPDGIDERIEHERATLRRLRATAPESDADRLAADVLAEDLETTVDLFEAGEPYRQLNVIASPLQSVRMCFDLMPTATRDDWATIATRMKRVPEALAGIEVTLTEGARQGLVAARRQAVACTQQADAWAGRLEGTPPFFVALLEAYDAARIDDAALRRQLAEAAARATEAYASLGRYLVEEYLPHTTEQDAIGAERYVRFARAFNGMQLDLEETYVWGWEELHRVEHAMAEVAERILPGEPMSAVIEHLEADPERAIEGEDAFRQWLQDLLDRTVAQLDGVHFDIPEPVKQVEAMIAPPGGAAAMYYTGPSEDFSRPGRTWYPTLGKTRFPLWQEVSTCYHEGVPGHHLQIAQVRYLAGTLSRYQRTLAGTSGHAEGWALYAERLMGELGYLDEPDYELGMLNAHAFRAARVVLDIGLHLELPIPTTERYHPGERWTPELALPFMIEHMRFPVEFLESELDRYLGWAGQAISYKVGERVWLRARDTVRKREGAAFDQKAFHARALNLGPMGLTQLERELTRAD